jgi:hypothetical protein
MEEENKEYATFSQKLDEHCKELENQLYEKDDENRRQLEEIRIILKKNNQFAFEITVNFEFINSNLAFLFGLIVLF